MGRVISMDRFSEAGAGSTAEVVEQLRPLARPLASDADLDPLIERIGDARYVLLGEATHGTSEFYTWRARLTRRLVREKGFSFVGVEGDWPDCYRVNRYVKGLPDAGRSANEVLHTFDRWPTWMWANAEVADLVEWLRRWNDAQPDGRRVGFYGLDVYSLWDSMRAVTDYLGRVDPEAARAARRAYECFAPYGEDVQDYARATVLVPASCENEVAEILARVREGAPKYDADGGDGFFDAEQNALVARNAEHYYRTMVRGGAASWNVRDGHMAETLDRLMAHHGPHAKAIVWEHNTHVGDARYTDMAADGEVNVGQLVREAHGADGVVLVGLSTHRGTVIAGDERDAPMRSMAVPAAREGSFEDALHRLSARDKLLIFSERDASGPLAEPRGHRAIGVVYRPAFERFGNYVPTVLPKRYDALLHVDVTRALSPLHLTTHRTGEPDETYPTGM